MKQVIIFFMAISNLGFSSARAAEVLSAKQLDVHPTGFTKPWNARVFPLNAYTNQVHIGLDRHVSNNLSVGVELAYGSGFNYFMADGYVHYKESYVGPYVQYFLNESHKGFFAEGGVNLVFLEAQYDQHTLLPPQNYPERTFNKTGTFAMPHLTANYRTPNFLGGFNATGGLGVHTFLGPKINFSEAENPKEASAYDSNLRLRVRLDFGYNF